MCKKHFTFISILLSLLLLLGTGCGEPSDSEKESVKSLKEISVDELDEDFDLYYVDELHILEKYCFITADEYDDADTGYSDITYYVYEGDQPMDEYDLFEEHYIAKFYDKSGNPHLASFSNRDWDFSKQLNDISPEEPAIVSVYVSAATMYESQELIRRDKELNELRTDALTAFSSESGIPYEGIFLIFKSEAE